MKKFEAIFVFLFICSIFLKGYNILVANQMMLISAIILGILYFAFGLFLFNDIPFRNILKLTTYKKLSVQRVFSSILLGVVFSLMVVGITCKFLFFPGGEELLLIVIGAILLGIIGIIVITFLKKGRTAGSSGYKKRILIRIITGLAFSLVVLFIPTKNLATFYYRNDTEMLHRIYKRDSLLKSNEIRTGE